MEQGFVVTIPTTMDPFVVDVNGKIYSFPAGTEQEVNQEVYEVIQNIQAQEPKPVAPSGGGTYPDWNASDGEPGHILNRPFYEEPRVLFDQVIDFTQENPEAGTYIVNEAWPINAGDTVVVTWDGVRYECVATTHQFGVVFGDFSGMMGGESTGEPFMGMVSSAQGISGIMAKDPAVYSVKVEAMEIQTLDPKFIPAGVGGGVTILYANIDDPYVYKNTNYREEDKLTKSELLGYIRSGIVVIGNVGEAWEEYYYPDSAGTDDESNYSWVRTTNNGVFFSKEYVFEGGGEN